MHPITGLNPRTLVGREALPPKSLGHRRVPGLSIQRRPDLFLVIVGLYVGFATTFRACESLSGDAIRIFSIAIL